MVHNVPRYLISIGLFLALAVGCLLFKDPTFTLGLDLQGGTRYVYRFDFDQAREDGKISENEPQAEVLTQTLAIIRNRIDPTGVKEASFRTQGEERIVIEIPGVGDVRGEAVEGTLAEGIDAGADRIVLAPGGAVAGFPPSGGVVEVGGERIRYYERSGPEGRTLMLEADGRGIRGTPVGAHPADATVRLVSTDSVRNQIENLGDLSFDIVATDSDFFEAGTDLREQRDRLAAWVAETGSDDLRSFNLLDESEGGPHPYLRWLPNRRTEDTQTASIVDRAVPLLRLEQIPRYAEDAEDWGFTGRDLARVGHTADDYGQPAVAFVMRDLRTVAFREFTGRFVDRQMAISLNGEVQSAPRLEQALGQESRITGGSNGFTFEETNELIMVMRSGSLQLRPQLEAEERVGPTLGADYIRRGEIAGIAALLAVLVFVGWYYKRLGLFAVVSLSTNMVLLMGMLSFREATLTLPGLAGIVLTVGMAVDANILIFDRIREELDNGQKIKQAAKAGFENAARAILDSNVTTLLTAIILYLAGTGPVRGFAVTLSIGILTSVFSALVVTRILVHFALEKGVDRFPMGAWLAKANFDWLGKRKFAFAISAVAIACSVGIFAGTPSEKKFGIDFLGGAAVQFRTETPHTVQEMRELVAGSDSDVAGAEIKPVIAASAGSNRYTAFRAVFKVAGGPAEEGGEVDFEPEIRAALGDVLQKGPLEVALPEPGSVDLRIYLTAAHSAEDVVAVLEAAGVRSPEVAPIEGRDDAFTATGAVGAAETTESVETAVLAAFRDGTDSIGRPYELATPVPESTVVGAQVVGELQSKALAAIVFSLFAIVLYIRARFAEYSYGFAAVLAVAHDVLITLGVVVLMNRLGLLNTEIDLPMIAAFLTIIGYSLNDTIIIFDRVRENERKVEGDYAKRLNVSINQTLSRTILTSLTTFLAVGLIFAFNVGTGNTLEGFAFAMMFGIVTGTYSTVFVATPALVIFERLAAKRAARVASRDESGRKGAA